MSSMHKASAPGWLAGDSLRCTSATCLSHLPRRPPSVTRRLPAPPAPPTVSAPASAAASLLRCLPLPAAAWMEAIKPSLRPCLLREMIRSTGSCLEIAADSGPVAPPASFAAHVAGAAPSFSPHSAAAVAADASASAAALEFFSACFCTASSSRRACSASACCEKVCAPIHTRPGASISAVASCLASLSGSRLSPPHRRSRGPPSPVWPANPPTAAAAARSMMSELPSVSKSEAETVVEQMARQCTVTAQPDQASAAADT
mmetsp:Transcript_15333/g.46310  ORF Transcript_15333/g.46310 Transcript_15333/m.46310 type:complete len:260 (-) Transcript_15333:616-1395(-)